VASSIVPPSSASPDDKLAYVFDSHCHLDFADFDTDRAAVWEAARQAGVQGLLVPAYAPSGWERMGELAADLPGVRVAVGVHPWALSSLTDSECCRALSCLPAWAAKLGAVAIGECGLDGALVRRGGAPWTLQERTLEAQLDVAEALGLPVVLHIVRAHGRALALLERRGGLSCGGVLHSYSGSAELVPRYAALNLSFSFAPSLTRDGARRPVQAARAVARDRLLVESDAPDQVAAGIGARSRGEPVDVGHVCGALATVRGEMRADVAEYTAHNARGLFGL